MKIALYIQDGLEQIVLTPETDTEKCILAKLHDGSREFALKHGSFFICRGGWLRADLSETRDDESTMIVMTPKAPEQPADHVPEQPGGVRLVPRDY